MFYNNSYNCDFETLLNSIRLMSNITKMRDYLNSKESNEIIIKMITIINDADSLSDKNTFQKIDIAVKNIEEMFLEEKIVVGFIKYRKKNIMVEKSLILKQILGVLCLLNSYSKFTRPR